MKILALLLAGLAIFPIVFANGLEPGAGPGLIFQTLPLAFGQMPMGTLFGTLFFVLLIFAGWVMSRQAMENELSLSPTMFNLWFITVRFVTPVAVAIVFIYNLM